MIKAYILIAFYVILNPFFSSAEDVPNQKKVMIIGHRGAAGLAPENTLSGIETALAQHVEMIEIDVRQSRDSVLVLMHDKKINRTTNGKGNIGKLTYSELTNFSAGVKFNKKYESEKIPTLSEVLKLINGKCILMIELKKGDKHYPGIVKRTIEAIQENNAESWCIINSFDAKILDQSKKFVPEIKICRSIVGKIPGIPVFLEKGIKFGSVARYKKYEQLNFMYKFGNKKFVKSLQDMNVKVLAWTVNKPSQIEKTKNKGVDGIITNFPNYR